MGCSQQYLKRKGRALLPTKSPGLWACLEILNGENVAVSTWQPLIQDQFTAYLKNTIWVLSGALGTMLENGGTQEVGNCLYADSVPWPLSQRLQYLYNVCFLRPWQPIKLPYTVEKSRGYQLANWLPWTQRFSH